MWALYLRRKSALYRVHKFALLLLTYSIAAIQGEDHESELLAQRDDRIVRISLHMDLFIQNRCIINLSLAEFVSRYASHETSNGSSVSYAHTNAATFIFLDEHPSCRTHVLKKRKTMVVPDIFGPRLPNRNELHTDDKKKQFRLSSLFSVYAAHFIRIRTNFSKMEHIGLLSWGLRIQVLYQEITRSV